MSTAPESAAWARARVARRVRQRAETKSSPRGLVRGPVTWLPSALVTANRLASCPPAAVALAWRPHPVTATVSAMTAAMTPAGHQGRRSPWSGIADHLLALSGVVGEPSERQRAVRHPGTLDEVGPSRGQPRRVGRLGGRGKAPRAAARRAGAPGPEPAGARSRASAASPTSPSDGGRPFRTQITATWTTPVRGAGHLAAADVVPASMRVARYDRL